MSSHAIRPVSFFAASRHCGNPARPTPTSSATQKCSSDGQPREDRVCVRQNRGRYLGVQGAAAKVQLRRRLRRGAGAPNLEPLGLGAAYLNLPNALAWAAAGAPWGQANVCDLRFCGMFDARGAGVHWCRNRQSTDAEWRLMFFVVWPPRRSEPLSSIETPSFLHCCCAPLTRCGVARLLRWFWLLVCCCARCFLSRPRSTSTVTCGSKRSRPTRP